MVVNLELYNRLTLEPSANNEEIRKAFRKLSKKLHPDMSKGNPKLFQKILTAYTILINPESRKLYDETGEMKEISRSDSEDFKLRSAALMYWSRALDQSLMTLHKFGRKKANSIDYVELARELMREDEKASQKAIDEARVSLSFLRSMSARVSAKPDCEYSELLFEGLEGKIEALSQHIQNMEKLSRELKNTNQRVEILLNDFIFRYDIEFEGDSYFYSGSRI